MLQFNQRKTDDEDIELGLRESLWSSQAIKAVMASKYDWIMKNEFKRMSQARIRDLLYGGSKWEIESYMDKIFVKYFKRDPKKKTFYPVSRNMRKIIKRQAAKIITKNSRYKIYIGDKEDDELTKKHNAFLRKSKYMKKLLQAVRIALYQNISAIYPAVLKNRWGEEELVFMVISPSLFMVKTIPGNYLEPEAVGHCQEDEKGRVFWRFENNDTISEVFDNGKIIVDGAKNPYGVLRWVFLRLKDGEDFYSPGETDDLISGEETLMLSKASALQSLIYQSFGVIQAINYKKASLSIAPGDIVKFDDIEPGEKAGLEFIQFHSDFIQALDFAEKIRKEVAINNNIPRSSAGVEGTGTESGIRELLENLPLFEDRAEYIPSILEAEYTMFEVLKRISKINQKVIGYEIPEDAKIVIDHAEPRITMTRKEELEVFELERKLGLTNSIEKIRDDNSDVLDDAQAEAVFVRNNKINSRFYGGGVFSEVKKPDEEVKE